jgi:hypothetical protein
MALPTEASELEKIENALRLPGLKFPEAGRLIGKNNINLMIALGAFDVNNRRAGKPLVVVRRLCVVFEAAVHIQKDRGIFDIDSDQFFAEVLISMSNKHGYISKYLTPNSIRLAIDLYVKAFARSGWKRIKRQPHNSKQAQTGGTDQRDAAKLDGDGGEGSTEVLEIIQPVADLVKLEKLVKQWMILRSVDRRKKLTSQSSTTQKPTAEKPMFEFEKVDFPRQKPNESVNAYMLRLQHEFQNLHRGKQAEHYVLSHVSEQRRERLDSQLEEMEEQKKLFDLSLERIDQQSNDIDWYKKLADQRRERLDQQADEIDGYKKLADQRRQRLDEQYLEIQEGKKLSADHYVLSYVSEQRRELLDQQRDEIKGYKELAEQRRVRIEKQFQEIETCKERMAAMQDTIDTHNDVYAMHQDTIRRQNELKEKMTKAITMQTEVLEMEQEIRFEQNRLYDKLEDAMDGQDDIVDIQDQLTGELRDARFAQGVVMGRQNVVMGRQEEVMDRQDEVMDRQDEVMFRTREMMDKQDEVLAGQELERRARALESAGISPFALGEGHYQAGRFPESFERGGAPDV